MSTGLLQTHTVDFLGLMGNGRTFRVPAFQRDYSWSEEYWQDLWYDVQEQSQPDSRHYMGAIVVASETDRDFLVIDGQQRLATLSILALAVIKSLEELAQSSGDDTNKERAIELRHLFIGTKDPASLVERSKLTLNDSDRGFYQDYLVQGREPSNPRTLISSNRLLWECYQYFRRQIKSHNDYRDGKILAELLSEVVARRLLFILITVGDEVSAYTVFETLNARGLELTVTDLLKNYLFAKMKATEDLEFVKRTWQRLTSTVGQEHFSEFLRYHYLTRFSQIRSGKLFGLVRSEVQTNTDVLELLKTLEPRAELYEALFEPQSPYWLDTPEAKRWLRELSLFGVKQMTPLLFAAYERLDSKAFCSILRMVAIVSFRYTIIGRLNPRELETVYHQGALAIIEGRARTPEQVFETIKSVYVPDDKFQSDFTLAQFKTSGRRKKLAKYVLCELESQATGGRLDFETNPATIEHVLPENVLGTYESFLVPDQHNAFVYRLGNLTLLSDSMNRQVGNAAYEEKVKAYRCSEYQITRDLAETAPGDWTPALIESRQEDMAAKAVKLWRLDF
ncbi:MAG TPA: DUF262 domain-containing HNH endonuclease family protein [Fimbriimonadaceae bacterium]|nr:DUF262 domain-containing HNH endonuclease family protein [Fimbriimonadaceae bacterium]